MLLIISPIRSVRSTTQPISSNNLLFGFRKGQYAKRTSNSTDISHSASFPTRVRTLSIAAFVNTFFIKEAVLPNPFSSGVEMPFEPSVAGG